MTKLEYIKERMSDKELREDLLKVVPDVDALIPQSENEFSDIQKLIAVIGALFFFAVFVSEASPIVVKIFGKILAMFSSTNGGI